MGERIREFTHFLGIEKENELKTVIILGDHFLLIHNLDILFQKSLEVELNKAEFKIPTFLFMNAHREFYLSMASFLRLHSSNSFRNLRCAIDSTLTAYYLLKYPDSREIYLSNVKKEKNEKWNKIFRNIKKTIKGDLDTFKLADGLCQMHEFCSIFTHSDALGVMTRYIEDKNNLRLEANYCDYEKNQNDYKKWFGALLYAFFMIFVVFWKELFEKIASNELSKKINIRIDTYKSKLDEFRKQYPFGPTDA